MMALFLLALVVIVGVVNSAAIGEEGNHGDSEWPAGISLLDSLSYWRTGEKASVADDKKKPCCLPKLWTGRLFTEYRLESPVGGVTYHYEHVVYFDQPNRRTASDLVAGNRTYASQITIFNKTGATQYTFSKATKRCSKEFLPGARIRQQCIPANATLLRAFSLGAGRGALKTQLWGYWHRDRHADSAANILVTPADCVPVSSAFRTTSRDARTMDAEPPKRKRTSELNVATLFTDIKTNIADQSVFKPPSYCKKREDEEVEEDEEEEEEDKKLYFDHQDFHINALIESFVAAP